MTKLEFMMERSAGKGRAIIKCSSCSHYDFREMTDEGYCDAMDGEPVRLYRKLRPDWCPKILKRGSQ